jgi:hypothetical protein
MVTRVSVSLFSVSFSDIHVTFGYMSYVPKIGWCCTVCGKNGQNKAHMRRHIDTTHGLNIYRCPYCDHISKSESTRHGHVRRVHQQKISCKEIRAMVD